MSTEVQKIDVLALIDLQILVGEAAIQGERDESGPNVAEVEAAHEANVRNLHVARAAVAELIAVATKFNGLLGGRSIPDNMTVHNVQIKAMDFYRLQESLKRVRGAP
jgi:hypothetical protein